MLREEGRFCGEYVQGDAFTRCVSCAGFLYLILFHHALLSFQIYLGTRNEHLESQYRT